MTFFLHPRLEADSLWVHSFGLCQLRLLNDQRFPWLILVPQVAEVIEWTDLEAEEQSHFLAELNWTCDLLEIWVHPFKTNLGALGNLVPQFHFHVIGRFREDEAWPGPVWGCGTRLPYPDPQEQVETLRNLLLTL
ncbi:MAG: HIT family protein [Acidobacteria bacterium]|nr:HIT family protein [Acidobacteriota bacterium]MCB9397818.1 HIT family protein [Acidobacteriota bacterium]